MSKKIATSPKSTAAADLIAAAKKPAAVAKKAATPKKAAKTVRKAGYGVTAEKIVNLGVRKNGMTAAELREVTGWRNVCAKAIAERFAATWGYKAVPVARKDGTAAYRLANA